MDFGSFENTIDKNIETDKASDKFDQQLQAYKNAGNSLTLAKSELETAASSLKWRKRSIPTHSGWLYPLTFDAGKGLKEA